MRGNWLLNDADDSPLVMAIGVGLAMIDKDIRDGQVDVEVVVRVCIIQQFLDSEWSVAISTLSQYSQHNKITRGHKRPYWASGRSFAHFPEINELNFSKSTSSGTGKTIRKLVSSPSESFGILTESRSCTMATRRRLDGADGQTSR